MFAKIEFWIFLFFGFGLAIFGFTKLAEARTFEWTFPDSNTIRIHTTASSYLNLISPNSDCGSVPGSWAFYVSAPDVGDTVFAKTDFADNTDDIILPDGDYEEIRIVYGSTASDWNDLYNNKSCNSVQIFAEAFTMPHTASSSQETPTSTTISSAGLLNPLVIIPFLAFCGIILYAMIKL